MKQITKFFTCIAIVSAMFLCNSNLNAQFIWLEDASTAMFTTTGSYAYDFGSNTANNSATPIIQIGNGSPVNITLTGDFSAYYGYFTFGDGSTLYFAPSNSNMPAKMLIGGAGFTAASAFVKQTGALLIAGYDGSNNTIEIQPYGVLDLTDVANTDNLELSQSLYISSYNDANAGFIKFKPGATTYKLICDNGTIKTDDPTNGQIDVSKHFQFDMSAVTGTPGVFSDFIVATTLEQPYIANPFSPNVINQGIWQDFSVEVTGSGPYNIVLHARYGPCIVTIPDANFKAALIGISGLDANSNSEIDCAEAQSLTGLLDVSSYDIHDLTGISAFTNIEYLNCSNNALTDLDVSSNTALLQVYCSNNLFENLNVSNNISLTSLLCDVNELSGLDISNNTALTQLDCSNNNLSTLSVIYNTSLDQLLCANNLLTSIDVSANTDITTIDCSNNLITDLDVSANVILSYLVCNNNLLTSLNVKNGNNTNFSDFNATDNAGLSCIMVDDATWSATNWTNIDAWASYSNTACAPAVSWIGLTSSNWSDGTNWSTGTMPAFTDVVFINSGAPNNPVVDLGHATPAVCNNLKINSGATLAVAPSMALTVNGNTTIDAAASFTIESDASGTGSFINVGTITGNATVEKFLPQGRWWYIGTPVAASTGADAFTSLSSIASTGNRLLFRDEVNHVYTTVVDADVLDPMKGYTFRTYTGSNVTANYTGELNTGEYGTDNNLTRTSSVSFSGFNLVANPFPSAIDFSSTAAGLTRTNMVNTIWYRQAASYATFNTTSDIGANGGQQYIPAMQAFWVQVDPAYTVGTLKIANAARVHSNQAFYKTTTMDNVFRLQVSSNNSTDEAVVSFFDNAQAGFETFDSEKMFSDDENVAQIYTLTTDNTEAIINGFPTLGSSEIRVVPMGFKTDVAGTFTFDASNISEFDANIPVSLEDALTGTMQDLRQNASYSFTSGVANTANRFRLHFGTMATSIQENANSSVAIYAYSNNIYLNTPQSNSLVEVYDMLGNLVYTQLSKSGMNTVSAYFGSGIYMVKVQGNGIIKTEKIVISKQ